MKNLLILIGILALSSSAVLAQKPAKGWPEWDKKEVDKMLNSSPWGQTQTETDTSEMTYSPTSANNPITTGGANNQSVDLKYRIRLFSARPIREAFARRVLMANPNLKPEQLNGFINGDYSDMIVVAVAVEANDRRYSGPIEQKFNAATTETLKNSAFIERSDGKKVFVDEYSRPATDGTGAKFVFPRIVDGKPFLSSGESFMFVAELGGKTKVSWRFKAQDLVYRDILEY